MTPPRNIILVGFMASGKTSVGRALARADGRVPAGRWWMPTTWWTPMDVIVARAGKPDLSPHLQRGRRTGLPEIAELERRPRSPSRPTGRRGGEDCRDLWN